MINLEDYFNSKDYPTGPRGLSALHDCIAESIIGTQRLKVLKNAIKIGLNNYLEHNKDKDSSLQDVEAIKKICSEATDVGQLTIKLREHFTNNPCRTENSRLGRLDDSILESIRHVERLDNLGEVGNVFGYVQDSPQKRETSPEFIDTKQNITLNLTDHVQYAIDKYISERQVDGKMKIPAYRYIDLHKLKKALSEGSEEEQITALKQALKEFKHAFNSDLKAYVEAALKRYEKGVNEKRQGRFVPIRTWEPPKGESKGVVIFLHGWHDSLEAATVLGREALKEDLTFIAYDHRSHGLDAQREQTTSTDLIRTDFRKMLEDLEKKYPDQNIALVGHSMGGAVLLAENKYIAQHDRVKQVSLLAPAVMSGMGGKMISPFKLLYRNMHKETEAAQRSSRRFGGKGPTLFGLLNLMRKAAKCMRDLFTKKETPGQTANWHIYTGGIDQSVNRSEFDAVSPEKIDVYKRITHAFFDRGGGTMVRDVIRDIRSTFSPPVSVPKPEENQPSGPSPS